MPMHDWTRVDPGIYHDLHSEWMLAIKHALNDGLLPPDYYALAEQRVSGTLGIGPDVLALDPTRHPATASPRGGIVAAAPTVALMGSARRRLLPRPRRVTVRHVSGHEVVALVELVSPANKHGRRSLGKFLDKLDGAIDQDINLAVIDPFPPSRSNPHGLHAAFWDRLRVKPPFQLPSDRPLCAVGYRPRPNRVQAYIQPFAVGGPVPPLPLYLRDELYVTLPLEATYLRAFEGVPRLWRERMNATS